MDRSFFVQNRREGGHQRDVPHDSCFARAYRHHQESSERHIFSREYVFVELGFKEKHLLLHTLLLQS